MPAGDIGADMDVLRAFYEKVGAKFADKKTRVRLREEDESAEQREAS